MVRQGFRTNIIAVLVTVWSAVGVAAGVPSASAAQFPVRNDLGTPAGYDSKATAINGGGTIVGNRYPFGSSTPTAFRWDSVNGMVDVGTLGGAASAAVAINDAGDIIGISQTTGGASHGYSWNSVDGMVDLGTLGTGTTVTPSALNESGTVVGQALVDASHVHAFAWDAVNGIHDLGTLGGSQSAANAINDSGVVVGWSDLAGDTARHAFVWDSVNGMVDLGTLGGSFAAATAINNAGQIAGLSNPASGPSRVFRRDPAGPLLDLGRTAGFVAEVDGIDAAGNVAGWGFDQFESARAFVATPATGVVEFDVGLPLAVVRGVSDNGHIVGVGFSTSGLESEGFVRDAGRGVQLVGSLSDLVNPVAVNDAGVVVGSTTSGAHFSAARWVPTTAKTVALGNATIVEGDTSSNRTVKFAVTLSEPSSAIVKVPYSIDASVNAHAATPGTDFAVKHGTVTFRPRVSTGLSVTTMLIATTIKDDLTAEGAETIAVSLSEPTGGGYSLGASVVTANVLDTDPPSGAPTAFIGDATIWEGDVGSRNVVQVPLTLDAPAAAPMSVKVTVSNGTATSPGDFKAFTQTLKFNVGQRQKFVSVRVNPDTTIENDKTVNLKLTNATGGLAVGRADGVVTILNDDY